MHTSESLLTELRAKSFVLIEKYFNTFKAKLAANPDDALGVYAEHIADQYTKDQAGVATDLLHKSIMEGVDDQNALVIGVLQVNQESAVELRIKIGQIMNS